MLNPKYPTIEHERDAETFAIPQMSNQYLKKTGFKDKISEAR